MSDSNEAVWKKPAWITAMVGLVSAFMTLPDVIGNYLEKRQDIELAKVAIGTVQIQNSDIKQDQEFKIVNNTLALQGTERVFVLRYLAATLDDDAAKGWAHDEVIRLNKLATEQEKLAEKEQELKNKEEELDTRKDQSDVESKLLEGEISTLRQALNKKNTEISQLRQSAGIVEDESPQALSLISLHFNWSADIDDLSTIITNRWPDNNYRFRCERSEPHCQGAWGGGAPDTITIANGAVFSSLEVINIKARSKSLFSRRTLSMTISVVPYTCAPHGRQYVCLRKLIPQIESVS